MICETIELNPLPSCMVANGTIEINGFTASGNTSEALICKITNMATGRVELLEVNSDGGGVLEDLDISELYDLMNHRYELKFYDVNNAVVPITVDNTEGDEVTSTVFYFNTVNYSYSGTFQVTAQ